MFYQSMFGSYGEAVEECARIQPDLQKHDLWAKIEKSSYHGYYLRLIPSSLAMDMDTLDSQFRWFNPRESSS